MSERLTLDYQRKVYKVVSQEHAALLGMSLDSEINYRIAKLSWMFPDTFAADVIEAKAVAKELPNLFELNRNIEEGNPAFKNLIDFGFMVPASRAMLSGKGISDQTKRLISESIGTQANSGMKETDAVFSTAVGYMNLTFGVASPMLRRDVYVSVFSSAYSHWRSVEMECAKNGNVKDFGMAQDAVNTVSRLFMTMSYEDRDKNVGIKCREEINHILREDIITS